MQRDQFKKKKKSLHRYSVEHETPTPAGKIAK